MRKRKFPDIYLAVFVSILAVGVGAAVSLSTLKNKAKTTSEPEQTFQRVSVVWDENEPETDAVNAPVSGIPDDRMTEAETVPEKREFGLPMGKDVIKDYSDGEMVRSSTMGDWRVHNGIDFGGSEGNTVRAAADGTVISVTDDGLWGGIMEIDHGGGVILRYCGLAAESCLAQGSEVKKGQKIAVLGSIPLESADGSHLHIEASINGKLADPFEVMGIAYAGDE